LSNNKSNANNKNVKTRNKIYAPLFATQRGHACQTHRTSVWCTCVFSCCTNNEASIRLL